jgi:hypothetical protein
MHTRTVTQDEIIQLEKEYTTARRMMAKYYNQTGIPEEYKKGDAWMIKCREIRQKIDELKSKQN